MKTRMMLVALGASLLAASAVPAAAMPAAVGLQQAAPMDVTQVYHDGRRHRRYPPRVRVYPDYAPNYAYGRRYHYDDLSQYPYVRGFGDRNPVPRGNWRGCTVDLGYGRYESCDR